MILAGTGDELSCRQAQNGVTFDFEVKFDLEGQGQSPPKTIGILTKVFYTYGPNLVILAWTGDELSRGQASYYRTHGRTHRQTQATIIPEGQKWPRVKKTNTQHVNAYRAVLPLFSWVFMSNTHSYHFISMLIPTLNANLAKYINKKELSKTLLLMWMWRLQLKTEADNF